MLGAMRARLPTAIRCKAMLIVAGTVGRTQGSRCPERIVTGRPYCWVHAAADNVQPFPLKDPNAVFTMGKL